MTRWARAKSVHQHCKQPEESTPWSEFLIQKNEADKKRKKSFNKEEKNLKSLKKKKCKKSIEKAETELDKHSPELKNKTKIKKKLKKNKKDKNTKVFSDEPTTNFAENNNDEPRESEDKQNSETVETVEELNRKNLHKKQKQEQLKEVRKMKRQLNGITLLPEKVENKIYKLKVTLRKKGVSGAKIKEIVRKERRKQEIILKKETFKNKQVCFHCRESGHQIAKCPALLNDTEQGTGICFKCGSTEHKVHECSAKIKDYPFAKCFICKKQGHLSRSCPNNQKGLYPNGGQCNQCGKIDHLKKDCPELKKIEVEPEILLPTFKTSMSADADIDEYLEEEKRGRHKVVKF